MAKTSGAAGKRNIPRDTARAMSKENVEAVRTVYERWADGDFQADLDLLDPYVVLVHDPEFEAGGPSYGIDAVTAFTRGMLEAWTQFTIEAEEIIRAGDSVFVGVRQRGVGRASGVATDLRYFMVWTFRGRKVVRFESIRERARALEAAGLGHRTQFHPRGSNSRGDEGDTPAPGVR